MNTKTSTLCRAAAIAALALTASLAHAGTDDTTMSVDGAAPLRATLLPTVTITADAARPNAEPHLQVASTAPLEVTLLPTVRVTAQAPVLAAVQLPVVRVTARAEALPATYPVATTATGEARAFVPTLDTDTEEVAQSPNLHVMPQ